MGEKTDNTWIRFTDKEYKIRTDMIGTLFDNDDISLEYNIRYHQSAGNLTYPHIWVNYNDLTVLPHWKSWFGNHPQMAQQFKLVKYYNSPSPYIILIYPISFDRPVQSG
jgi:hypothetical protein